MEWGELVEASPTATPFQTPEWVGAWMGTLGRGRRPHVIQIRDDSHLVGLMPMVRTAFPWRSLRAMGAGVSDYLHPLAREGYEDVVADLLWKHFGGIPGVDLVDLQQIRETSALATRSQGSSLRDEDCFVLDLPSTWDAYVSGLGKSMRYEARRIEKPPYSSGEATIETLSDPVEVRQGMDAFFELHARRWKTKKLPGVFAFRRVREFHYRFAEQAASSGLLRLTVLRYQDRIVGALYVMRVNKTAFFYQSGFDPLSKALSPGSVLVASSIREAIESGATQFDFLRGPEDYKLRWKPQHRLTNLRLFLPRNVLLGRIGLSMNTLRFSLEAQLRRKLASH